MSTCVVECTCGKRMRAPEAALGGYGTCVHCGARIHLSEATVWRPKANATECVRCHHAFRGDWDRRETAAGTLCQKCARMYEPPPDMGPTEPVYALEQAKPAEVPEAVADEPEEKPRDRGRAFLIYLGVCAAVLAVYVALPLDEPIKTLMGWLTPAPPEVPEGSWLERMVVLDVLVSLAYHFIVLYATLYWCQLLPNEDRRNNVIAVGVMAIGLYLIGLIAINPFLLAATVLIRLMLVSHVYDMGARDLAKYIFVAFLLMPVMPILRKLLYGFIALIAY